MGYVDAALARAIQDKCGSLAEGLSETCLDDIRSFLLSRDPKWLWGAFYWGDSPQGHEYWAARANKTEAVTEEDRSFLKDLLAHYRPAPEGDPPVYPYQIAQKLEDLCAAVKSITHRREIAIAITHMETAAMWLNKAQLAAKKDT